MSEVKLHTCAALRSGASPEAVKEAVYHCAPYIGLGKAEAAAAAVNEVLRTQGISPPLASQRTVSEEDRLTAGIAAQKSIFGPHIDEMRAAAPNDKKAASGLSLRLLLRRFLYPQRAGHPAA